ncbi:MAG: ATP-binding cassette domain-containing protein [Oscillospiraceae bacterium]|nr:ATP-binding cassette domain-containing protein [Oscillospiraceae bacterium]
MQLEARGIKFGYDKSRLILDDVLITIKPGERVGMIGPSGCGKSTLALILSGYITPQGGDVFLGGKPLPKKGFCPVQLIHQNPEKSLNPRIKLKESLGEAWSPPAEFLDKVGITAQWLERYPRELSAGELQRFCIARVFAEQTRFIIADEISVMLDVITQAQIWEFIINETRQREIGLLAITHSAELARKICTRVIEYGQ